MESEPHDLFFNDSMAPFLDINSRIISNSGQTKCWVFQQQLPNSVRHQLSQCLGRLEPVNAGYAFDLFTEKCAPNLCSPVADFLRASAYHSSIRANSSVPKHVPEDFQRRLAEKVCLPGGTFPDCNWSHEIVAILLLQSILGAASAGSFLAL